MAGSVRVLIASDDVNDAGLRMETKARDVWFRRMDYVRHDAERES